METRLRRLDETEIPFGEKTADEHSAPTVLLVDDHAVVRAGFRHLLQSLYSINVLEAVSGEQAYIEYREHEPDMVVADMNMPGLSGLELVRKLTARHADAKILMLSVNEDSAYEDRARAAGALGYLPKSSAPEQLEEAIRCILGGNTYFTYAMARQETDHPADLSSLTAREFEVFRLLSLGSSVNDIAVKILNLSPKTVSNHRSNLMEKLQLKNSAQLTQLAIRHQIVDP